MARRIQGQLDEPLNDTGRQQARAAAARFAPGMVDAILCSDLGRAAQTAAPLGEATGVTVQPQAVWRERHFGRFQGWRYAEIAEQAPAVFARIEARDPDLDLDGGESLLQVRARIDAALQALVARYRGQRVVVVSHGGVLDAVYRLVTGKPVSEPRDFPIHNACICRLHWVDGQWHIDRWADNRPSAGQSGRDRSAQPAGCPAGAGWGSQFPMDAAPGSDHDGRRFMP